RTGRPLRRTHRGAYQALPRGLLAREGAPRARRGPADTHPREARHRVRQEQHRTVRGGEREFGGYQGAWSVRRATPQMVRRRARRIGGRYLAGRGHVGRRASLAPRRRSAVATRLRRAALRPRAMADRKRLMLYTKEKTMEHVPPSEDGPRVVGPTAVSKN